MRRITLAASAILASTFLFVVAVAADEAQKQSPAIVELTIRAPNGQPVADSEVTFRPYDQGITPTSCEVTAKTDGAGLARFNWPCASPKLLVKAPGAGYGVTGIFELSPGKTARPPLARLAPFGAIEGVVPPDLRKPGMVVSNGKIEWVEGQWSTVSQGEAEWLRTEAAVGADGHFVLKDVPNGYCFVHAELKGDKEPLAEAELFVEPGQSLKNVVLAKSPARTPPTPPNNQPSRPAEAPAEPKPIVWTEGTVHDKAGQPLEGTQVFARVMGNMYPVEAEPALSDSDGHWRILGPPGFEMDSGELLFCKFGYCPAFAPLRCPASGPQQPDKPNGAQQPRPPRYDIVLDDQCGTLEVLVTRDSKPLPDAEVSIAVDAAEPFGRDPPVPLILKPARGTDSWSQAAARILCPVAITGDDGIARFSNLIASVYAITVVNPAKPSAAALEQPRDSIGISTAPELLPKSVRLNGASFLGQAGGIGMSFDWPDQAFHGVVVAAGKTRRFHAVVGVNDFSVAVQLRNPDGLPAAHVDGGFGRWSDFSQPNGRMSDENGFGLKRFGEPGLQEIAIVSRGAGGNDNWVSAYFGSLCDVKAVAAASDLLRDSPPLTLTMVRRNNAPASLVVQLLDTAGKPAAGYVYVGRIYGLSFAASTDEQGRVRLEGLIPNTARVEGVLPGLTLPRFDPYEGPLPKDNDLIGRWQIRAREVIDCPNGKETSLVLRPIRVGYIRGTLIPAAGKTTEDYIVVEPEAGFSVSKSGQFVAGPCPEGKTIVKLQCKVAGDYYVDCASQEVDVRTDRVAHVEFNRPAPPPLSARYSQLCGVSPNLSLGPFVDLEVNVTLPDGRTPARGAQVALLVPNQVGLGLQGTTDFQGRFMMLTPLPMYTWVSPDIETKRDQIPTEPTIVAWLPGAYGPVIAPVKSATADGKLRLVLPPSSTQRGKVTIGGKAYSERRNAVEVMATREDPGPLRPLYSQYVSADPEGNFELPALAPGVYQVQATLDNIWLSPSVRIAVSADAAPLKPITLNIDEPGPASTVTVVDRQGRPLIDVPVTVTRPPGPLATLLWSHKFKSDGAGVAQIPPLEAGRHKLQIPGAAGESILTVSPLSDPKAEATSLRVTLDRPLGD